MSSCGSTSGDVSEPAWEYKPGLTANMLMLILADTVYPPNFSHCVLYLLKHC